MYSNRKKKHIISMIQTVNTSNNPNTTSNAEGIESQRPFLGGKISYIPNLASYMAIEKLKLGKNALEKIKMTLDIEHLSQYYYQERLKTNNFYINYERNPFLNEPANNSGGTNPRQKKSNKDHQDKDIVESISRLKEKTEFKNIMNRLTKEDSQANYIHRKMKDAIRNQQIARKAQRYVDKEFNEKQNQVREEQVLTDFEDFERIVNIKEDNFYQKHNRNKPVNIFKILTNNTHEYSYLTYSRLKKVYFCEDSTISKANAKKITNVFKDISYVPRLFIIDSYNKVPKDYRLVPADIKCILEQINFSDIMALASGIIQPEMLEAYLYEDGRKNKKNVVGGDQEGSSLVQDADQICYDDNQQNKSSLFRVQRHDKAQIETYINHPFSKVEKKQLMLSQMHKEKIMKYLNFERQCKSTNIRDERLLREITDKKKEILVELYEGMLKKQSGSIDKVIRLNKRSKDRIENVKNKVVIETVQKVKQMEKQIRSANRKGDSVTKWR